MFHSLRKWGYAGSSKKTPYQPPPSLRPPELGKVKTAASYSYAEIIDLITDGPIQGPANKDLIGVAGQNILQSVYFDSVPIAETTEKENPTETTTFSIKSDQTTEEKQKQKTIPFDEFADGIVEIFTGGKEKPSSCGSFKTLGSGTSRGAPNTWSSKEITNTAGEIKAEVYYPETKQTNANKIKTAVPKSANAAIAAFHSAATTFSLEDIKDILEKTDIDDDVKLAYAVAQNSKTETTLYTLPSEKKTNRWQRAENKHLFPGAAGIYGHTPKITANKNKKTILKSIPLEQGTGDFTFTRKELQLYVDAGIGFKFSIIGPPPLNVSGTASKRGRRCSGTNNGRGAISYLTPVFSKTKTGTTSDDDEFSVTDFLGGVVWPFWYLTKAYGGTGIAEENLSQIALSAESNSIKIQSNPYKTTITKNDTGEVIDIQVEDTQEDPQKYNFTNILCEFKKGNPDKSNTLENFQEVAILNQIGKELIGPFNTSGFVLRVLKKNETIKLGRGDGSSDAETTQPPGSKDMRKVPGGSKDFATWDKSSLNSEEETPKPITFDILNKYTTRIEISLAINSLADTSAKDHTESSFNDNSKVGDKLPGVVDITVEYGRINNTTGERDCGEKDGDGNMLPPKIKKYRIVGLIDSTTLVNLGNKELANRMNTDSPGGIFMNQYPYNTETPDESFNMPSEELILPEAGDDYTRYVKITKESYETNSILVNRKVAVDSITEIIPNKFSYPYSSIMGLKIDSRAVASIPRRNYLMRMKLVKIPSNYYPLAREFETNNKGAYDHRYMSSDEIPQEQDPWPKIYEPNEWDGKFKLAWTDNPAWILYDLLTNKRYGLGEYITEDNINKWGLYKAGRYCDAVREDGTFEGVNDLHGGLEPRFSCNIVFTEKFDAYDAVNQIASLFNGTVYFWNSEIHTQGDGSNEPIMMFSNSNVKDGEFVYASNRKDEQINSVEIVYQDRFDEFKKKIEYVDDEESIRKIGVYKKNISLLGVTSQAMARRAGKEIIYSSIYEQEHISFVTGLEATLCRPGDVIEVADEMKSIQRNHGRILNYAKNISPSTGWALAERIEIIDPTFNPAKGITYENGTLIVNLVPIETPEEGGDIQVYEMDGLDVETISGNEILVPRYKATNSSGNEIYLEFQKEVKYGNLTKNCWVFYEIVDENKYGTAIIFDTNEYETPFEDPTKKGWKYVFTKGGVEEISTTVQSVNLFSDKTKNLDEINNGAMLVLSNTFDSSLFKKEIITYEPKNRNEQDEYFDNKIYLVTYNETMKVLYDWATMTNPWLPTDDPDGAQNGIQDTYTAIANEQYTAQESEKYGPITYSIPKYTSALGKWRLIWIHEDDKEDEWSWRFQEDTSSTSEPSWEDKLRSKFFSEDQVNAIKEGKESPMSIMLDVMEFGYDITDTDSSNGYKWLKTDSDTEDQKSKIAFQDVVGGLAPDEIIAVTNQLVRIEGKIAAKRTNTTGAIMVFDTIVTTENPDGEEIEKKLDNIIPASPYRLAKLTGEDARYKIVSIIEENINEYKIIAKQFNETRENYIESTANAQTTEKNRVYKFSSSQSEIKLQKLEQPSSVTISQAATTNEDTDETNMTLNVSIQTDETNASYHKVTLTTPMGEKETQIVNISGPGTSIATFPELQEAGTYTAIVTTYGNRSEPSDAVKATQDYLGGSSGIYKTEFIPSMYIN